jgi:hypothetical protein
MNSHAIGDSPSRSRACTTALAATVGLVGLGIAKSSLLTTSVIGRPRRSAMPMTNQGICSIGSRRRRRVAVPVAASASSIHSGAISRMK